jgi:hypothetical protein
MDKSKPEAETPSQQKKGLEGVVIKEAIENFRAAFESADLGSGPNRDGKQDGMLDRVEMADACFHLQQGKMLSPAQVKALASIPAEFKIKIDDIVRPYEEAMKKCDRDGNGIVSPAEFNAAREAKAKEVRDPASR